MHKATLVMVVFSRDLFVPLHILQKYCNALGLISTNHEPNNGIQQSITINKLFIQLDPDDPILFYSNLAKGNLLTCLLLLFLNLQLIFELYVLRNDTFFIIIDYVAYAFVLYQHFLVMASALK